MSQRTRDCSRDDARTRLAHARAYLEVAELAAADNSDDALRGVATGVAVLAGIAAADAACCFSLGYHSRSQNHQDATSVVAEIKGPDALQASKALGRLVSLKDKAHYGFVNVSAADRGTALKNAARLVEFAERTAE